MKQLTLHLLKAACISFIFLQAASLQTTATIAQNYSTIPNTQTVQPTTKPFQTQIDPTIPAQSSHERTLKNKGPSTIGTISAEITFQSGIPQEEDISSSVTTSSSLAKNSSLQLIGTTATGAGDDNTFTSSSFRETSSLFASTNATTTCYGSATENSTTISETANGTHFSSSDVTTSTIPVKNRAIIAEEVAQKSTPRAENGTLSDSNIKNPAVIEKITPLAEKSNVSTEKSSLESENNIVTTENSSYANEVRFTIKNETVLTVSTETSTISSEKTTRSPEKSTLLTEKNTITDEEKIKITTETSAIRLETNSLASRTLSVASDSTISNMPLETSTPIAEKTATNGGGSSLKPENNPVTLENKPDINVAPVLTIPTETSITFAEKSTITTETSTTSAENSSLASGTLSVANNVTTSTKLLETSTPIAENSITNREESTVATKESSLQPENSPVTLEDNSDLNGARFTIENVPLLTKPTETRITSAEKFTITTETSTTSAENSSLACGTLSVANNGTTSTKLLETTPIAENSSTNRDEMTVPTEESSLQPENSPVTLEDNSDLNGARFTIFTIENVSLLTKPTETSITSAEKFTITTETSTTSAENSSLASGTLSVANNGTTSITLLETSTPKSEISTKTGKESFAPTGTGDRLATNKEITSTILIETSITSSENSTPLSEKDITSPERNTFTIATETSTSTSTPENRSFSNGISSTTPETSTSTRIAEKSTVFIKTGEVTLSDNTTISSSTKTVGTITEIEEATAASSLKEPKNNFKINITANITNRFLVAEISTTVINTDDTPKEVELFWILSQDAYISGFAIEMDGIIYDGYVREKSEGDKIYSKAKKKRMNVAKIATSDLYESNKFVTTENIEPNQTMIVRLTYEQLLQRTNGRYEAKLMIPPLLDLAPVESTIKVNINETRPIKILHTCFKQQEQISCESPQESARYVDKNNNKNAAIKARYPPEDGLKTTETGGEFIIWYDVDRGRPSATTGSEVLVHDGYFVHFFSPDDLVPIPRLVIFIIDSSGSMKDHKLAQLKKAMRNILFELRGEDLFQIIDFNTGVRVWDIGSGNVAYENLDDHWGSYYDEDAAFDAAVNILPAPFPADENHKENAKRIIENLEAYGATNTQLALDIGLLLVIEHTLEAGNKSHQAMIIFLTDGEASIGETSRENIISTVTKSNSKLRVPIFSISFGDEADRDLVRELSQKNFGLSRHIYESADASLQIENFYNEISSPLLRDVTFRYVDEDWRKLTKNNFGLYFQGSELIVAGKTGRINDSTSRSNIINVTVSARTGDGSISYFKATSAEATSNIERIWAYMTLRQFLDAKRISPNVTYYDREALKLSMKYSFVSPVSVMVVVKPDNSESAIELEDFLTDMSKNDDDIDPIIKQPPLFDYETGDFETQELDGDETRNKNFCFELIKSFFSRLRSILYGDETKTLTTISVYKGRDFVKSNICKYFHKICNGR